MTTQPTEALVVATPRQLEAISCMVGYTNVHRMVVGENNIAAFWSEGPDIMAQIRQGLPDTEQSRLKAWNELSPDSQETVVGMAAGTLDWAEDHTLHHSYVESVLDNDPELHAELLHPAAPPV